MPLLQKKAQSPRAFPRNCNLNLSIYIAFEKRPCPIASRINGMPNVRKCEPRVGTARLGIIYRVQETSEI